MPARRIRTTALIDDPEMPGASDLDQDVTPAKTRGRPRKSTATPATPARRGRPPGSGRITAARTASGQVMSVQAMKDTVAGELGMLLTLGVGALEMRDPEAAAIFLEPISTGRLGEVDPIEGMVDRTVNLLARNQKYLAYAAKGGVMTDVLGLAFLVGTVAKRALQLSAYRRAEGQLQGGLDDADYPAYTGTRPA